MKESSWDNEFQRLQSGETHHLASAELLHFQVATLVEHEPQLVEAWYSLEAEAGSLYFEKQFPGDDPSAQTYRIELMGPEDEEKGAETILEIIYLPTGRCEFGPIDVEKSQFAKAKVIIDDLRESANLTVRERDILDSLETVAEDMILSESHAPSAELLQDLGKDAVESIGHRTTRLTFITEFGYQTETEDLGLTFKRTVDMATDEPIAAEELDALFVDKEKGTAIHMTSGYDQDVLSATYTVEQEEDAVLHSATSEELQAMTTRLANLIAPTLDARDPDWLSQYSATLGASIHAEGHTTPYGVAMTADLTKTRCLFVDKFEGANQFMRQYGKNRVISPTELELAKRSGHVNALTFTAPYFVNFEQFTPHRLNGGEAQTGIYLRTRFLEPSAVLEGALASFGAHLEVLISIPIDSTTGQAILLKAGVVYNDTELDLSEHTLN